MIKIEIVDIFVLRMYNIIKHKNLVFLRRIYTMILFEIAVEFRKAIIQVKNNNEFDYRNRMYRFPSGCCDDSCDLLG